MYRPKDGKLEQLVDKYKVLKEIDKRREELESEIEELEKEIDQIRGTNMEYEEYPSIRRRKHPLQDRLGVGEDFRNKRIGKDFRTFTTGDYREGYKVTSITNTFDEDISDRLFI